MLRVLIAAAIIVTGQAMAQSPDVILRENLAFLGAVTKHKAVFSQAALSQPACGQSEPAPFDAAVSDIIRSMPALTALSERGNPDAVEIVSGAADFILTLGDTALKANCLDQADLAYRAVLRSYTGQSLSAARQRAQVGIDDVRSKRK